MRRSALATFPVGTPLLVVAPERAGFAALLAERGDPVPALRDLGEVAAGATLDPATPHLMIEGLDDCMAPEALLAGLRTRTPQARIFALFSNAAHLGSLATFFAGASLAAGHPLVPGEIEPLFERAGWRVLAIKTLLDDAIPSAASLPFAIEAGAITFNLIEPAMLDYCRIAALLVIADPQ
jgi:hypothetical protein